MGSNGFLLLSPATVLIIFSRLGKRFWSTLFGEELKGQFTWIEKGTWSGQLVSSYAHSFWTMCQDTEIWALSQWEKLLNSKSQITLLKLTLSIFFFLKKWEENALREWSSSTRPKSASQFWTKWSGLPFINWKELNKNFPLQEKFNSNISFLTGWQFSCKLCFESEPLMASVLFFS